MQNRKIYYAMQLYKTWNFIRVYNAIRWMEVYNFINLSMDFKNTTPLSQNKQLIDNERILTRIGFYRVTFSGIQVTYW